MRDRCQLIVTSPFFNSLKKDRAKSLHKHGRRAVSVLAAAAALFIAVQAASAATYYWDGNGATPGSGTNAQVTGTWETSGFWTTDSTGSSPTSNVDTTGADVVFVASDGVTADNPTGGYTVTLSANEAINSLTIANSGAPTFKATASSALSIGAGGVTMTGSSGDPTFDSSLTVILSANQTWTINNGHVWAINSAVAGSATVGNTLTWTLGYVNAFTPTVSGLISNGAAGGNLALTFNNFNGTSIGGGTYSITGKVNTYTGKTTLSAGSITVAALANLGAVSSFGAPTTVADGTIDLGNTGPVTLTYNNSAASSTNRVLNLAGTTFGVTIQNTGSGTLAFTSDMTATGIGAKTLTLRGSNTGLNTVGGAIVDSTGGATALLKTDAGQWVLGGNNTYTGGTTVNQGTLTVLAGSNLGANVAGNNVLIAGGNIVFGSGTNVGSNQTVSVSAAGGGIGVAADPTSFPTVTVAPGATVVFGLDYTGDGGIQTGTTAGFFTPSSTTFLGSFTTGTYTGATLTAGSGSTYRLGGGGGTLTIQNNVLIGANNLLIGGTGGGTVILPSANTYTGTTTIGASTVIASVLGNVGAASSSFGAPADATSATINLGAGNGAGTLDYTGLGETTNRVLNIASTTGSVALLNDGSGPLIFSNPINMTTIGAKTLTLGGGNGGTLSGVVDSPGSTSLTKTGAGTWILTGTNNYSGNTTVSGGVLQTPDLLPNSNLITLAGTNTALAVWQVQNAAPSTFARTLGTAPTTVNMAGGFSGFAAKTSKLTVTLSANAPLSWGSGNFLGAGGSALVFGSPTADAPVEFTNPVNLNTTDAFVRTVFVDQGLGGDSALMSGVISPGTGPSGFSKDGPGTLYLSAANTYSGQTIVKNGTLIALGDSPVGAAGVFGTGVGVNPISLDTAAATNNIGASTKTTASAALLIGGAFNIARPITIATTVTSGTYSIGGTTDNAATFSGLITFNQPLRITQVATTGSNALNITGGIAAGVTATLTFANIGAVNVSTNPITGATATVAQTGAGTTTLSAANTFGGGMTVSAGTVVLAAANALSGSTGTVTVQGGTLTSNVAATSLGGNLAMTSGFLAPDGSSAGTLTLAAGKNFSMSGGALDLSIASPASFDQILGTGAGTFSLTGTLDLTGDTIAYGSTYQILSGFASGTVSGLAITGYDTADFSANVDNTGLLSFTASAVPEPSSLALLLLAAPALLRRRRRTA